MWNSAGRHWTVGVPKAGELLISMASAMRQELCYLPECVQAVGTWDNRLYNTGCLQSETAWDISARQSDGHFLAPINVPRQLSPEFLLVILLMSSDLRRIGTPFFLAFAKKLKRWIRESVMGSFWLRQILHAKKVSGDAAPCRARRLSLRPVLCIEAKQAAVESVAPAAPAAVHIFGERNGRNRSPIANLRWLS